MTPYLKVKDVDIYYELKGQPLTGRHPTLVLVHGYLSSLFSFRDLIPYLEPHFSILTFDLPGFGKSEKSKTYIHSLDNYADTLLDILTSFNMNNVILVGHSMGGQICLRAARKDPVRIKKVIGLSAAGYMGRVKKQLRLATNLPMFPTFLRLYFRRYHGMKSFLDVTYDRSIITEEMMEGYKTPLKEKAFYHSLTRLIKDREGDLTSHEVKDIKQPVLLLWGKEDRIVPLRIGERFKKNLSKAELHVFEETGHLLPEERPNEVANAIIHFVNKTQKG